MKRTHALLGCLLVVLLVPMVGCQEALGLEDWQRDLLFGLLGGVFDLIGDAAGLGGQMTEIIIERNCFENGVQVDCSTIPQANS